MPAVRTDLLVAGSSSLRLRPKRRTVDFPANLRGCSPYFLDSAFRNSTAFTSQRFPAIVAHDQTHNHFGAERDIRASAGLQKLSSGTNPRSHPQTAMKPGMVLKRWVWFAMAVFGGVVATSQAAAGAESTNLWRLLDPVAQGQPASEIWVRPQVFRGFSLNHATLDAVLGS